MPRNLAVRVDQQVRVDSDRTMLNSLAGIRRLWDYPEGDEDGRISVTPSRA
jgi:hypothetical protein